MELHANFPLLIVVFFMTHDFMMFGKHVKHLSLSLSGNWSEGVGAWEENGRTHRRGQTNQCGSETAHPSSLRWGGWIYLSSFLKISPFVFWPLCLSPIVVWSESAAGPSAEGETWGGNDRWRLRYPYQPVLSSWQCGWGAQPEEGNVSESGYAPGNTVNNSY